MMTPSETVLAFISARYAWEMAANTRLKAIPDSNDSEKEALMNLATQEYHQLVSRFCATSVEPQGIAFGDDPTHNPACETIRGLSVVDQCAKVCTKSVGLDDFVSDYEYHLVLEMDEWRITSLLYVDEDRKFECL